MAREPEVVEQKGLSVSDIAATLLKSPAEGSDEGQEEETLDDTAEEQEGEEAEELNDGEADDQDELDTDDDAEGSEQGEEEDDGDEGEPEVVDIRDDDVLEVMVDGELKEFTIAELKKAASGEGAIEKRLQEATELRKTAHAERTTMLEKLAENERIVVAAFNSLDDNLFKEVIPAPPAGLKEKNPALYLRHKEAYDEDQARIKAAKEAINAKVQEIAGERTKRLKEYADNAAVVIAREIPELNNPKTRDATLAQMVQTARAYGYTDEEIGMALDPRMFMLIRDVMKGGAGKTGKGKETVINLKDVSRQMDKPIRRKLRSGGTKAAAFKQRTKVQEKVVQQARKTGKVGDVAATLIKKA